MDTNNIEDGVEVPAQAIFRAEHVNRYGSVPGLDDDELVDPQELERAIMLQEWGPVLRLPVRGKPGVLPRAPDEDGVEFGAFATVDFERTMPEFDKARYKADRLREELRDVLIMFSIVKRRLPRAKYRVLEHLRMGVIELEHIANDDMLALARFYLRARRLQREIRELGEASHARARRALAAVLS